MFYGYMLPMQLRGLALLSAIDDVGGWDGYLKTNFKQQAEVCQQGAGIYQPPVSACRDIAL